MANSYCWFLFYMNISNHLGKSYRVVVSARSCLHDFHKLIIHYMTYFWICGIIFHWIKRKKEASLFPPQKKLLDIFLESPFLEKNSSPPFCYIIRLSFLKLYMTCKWQSLAKLQQTLKARTTPLENNGLAIKVCWTSVHLIRGVKHTAHRLELAPAGLASSPQATGSLLLPFTQLPQSHGKDTKPSLPSHHWLRSPPPPPFRRKGEGRKERE